jgi:hypothetical protein
MAWNIETHSASQEVDFPSRENQFAVNPIVQMERLKAECWNLNKI